MRKAATLRLAIPFVALAACSSSGGPGGGATPGNSSGGSSGSPGSAADASAGSASGGTSGGGSGGSGGSSSGGGGSPSAGSGGSGGGSSSDGSSGGGSSDGGGGPPGGFTCNLLVGPSPMMQWFDGGFLQYPGIDATKWELITVAHHYTDAWAMPGDSAWNSPLHKGHACAQGSTTPDRVVFQATQWSHTTAAQWEKDLTGIVNNIKTKWPGVKRIELMASTSAPGDVPCPAAGGKSNETIIPPFAYQALDGMPAMFPGLVVALPHFEVPCSSFIGNGTAPQYAPSPTATSGPAIAEVVKVFGAYYVAHP